MRIQPQWEEGEVSDHHGHATEHVKHVRIDRHDNVGSTLHGQTWKGRDHGRIQQACWEGRGACVGGVEAGMEGGVPVSGQSQFNKRVRDVTLVVVPGTRGRRSSTSGSRCLSGTRAPCDRSLFVPALRPARADLWPPRASIAHVLPCLPSESGAQRRCCCPPQAPRHPCTRWQPRRAKRACRLMTHGF